eukprot:scaffold53512_cov48-Phaeocystis_antarctica.AAC.2
MKTSRPLQWTPAYGRLEKTQAYNLSLGPNTHDQLVAVTSTRRASTTWSITGATTSCNCKAPGRSFLTSPHTSSQLKQLRQQLATTQRLPDSYDTRGTAARPATCESSPPPPPTVGAAAAGATLSRMAAAVPGPVPLTGLGNGRAASWEAGPRSAAELKEAAAHYERAAALVSAPAMKARLTAASTLISSTLSEFLTDCEGAGAVTSAAAHRRRILTHRR